MKKMMKFLALALAVSMLAATSALALTANHAYMVQLSTVSASGQQTALSQMAATADASGKLSFQFSDVPDTGSASFLMVEIMDTVGGQQQVVRQTMLPAPAPGQHLQTGVNELSSRQARAARQAMMTGSDQALGAMFPLLMIPTGAIATEDADGFGLMAVDAASAFNNYLAENGVTAAQMTSFREGLLDAMRELAAANMSAAEQTDPVTAAGLCGQAGAQFMTALMQAAADAGIDPTLVSAAFDQAGQAIDNSMTLGTLPRGEIDAMHANFLNDAQQRRLMAQMSGYTAAMSVVGASSDQTQVYTMAMNLLQADMIQARQNFYQQAFSDPDNLPDPTRLEQALSNMQTTMENAFATFDQDTTATEAQIAGLLGNMAGRMNSRGGMMGGGMMSVPTLDHLGFGMLQNGLGGGLRNWSTMMLAAGDLAETAPDLAYTPATEAMAAQLAAENLPATPDWSQLPEGAEKSLLQLQYDLMLVHLIDLQTLAGLATPLTQDDLAALSAQNLANLDLISQGLEGLSDEQVEALLAAFSLPWLCPVD